MSDTYNQIVRETAALESVLKKLSENKNGTEKGKEQATLNLSVIKEFNAAAIKLVNDHSKTQDKTHGVGLKSGGSSASSTTAPLSS